MINHGYQKHNTYGSLKSVVLGSYYTADHFRYVKNAKIRSALSQVADEINQDLLEFEHFLKTQGVAVVRPDVMSVEEFYQYIEQHQQLPSPPLQPRNNHSVIGNTLYKIEPSDVRIDQCLANYCNNIEDLSADNQNFFAQSLEANKNCQHQGIWYCREKYQQLAGGDWPDFYQYVQGVRSALPDIQAEMQQFANVLMYNRRDFAALAGPNIFPTDHGVVIDSNEYCNYSKWAAEHIGQHRYISINTRAGHTDGCFVILGHQTILGIDPLIDYQQHFPNYHVVAVPDQSYIAQVDAFDQMRSKVNGRWWVPGQEHNQDFIEFVEHYCGSWTGFVEETVFDVNVLAIDPDLVCVSGHNPLIQTQLAARGINTVTIPWRHRFFVDGGLHCITLDLYRD